MCTGVSGLIMDHAGGHTGSRGSSPGAFFHALFANTRNTEPSIPAKERPAFLLPEDRSWERCAAAFSGDAVPPSLFQTPAIFPKF